MSNVKLIIDLGILIYIRTDRVSTVKTGNFYERMLKDD